MADIRSFMKHAVEENVEVPTKTVEKPEEKIGNNYGVCIVETECAYPTLAALTEQELEEEKKETETPVAVDEEKKEATETPVVAEEEKKVKAQEVVAPVEKAKE